MHHEQSASRVSLRKARGARSRWTGGGPLRPGDVEGGDLASGRYFSAISCWLRPLVARLAVMQVVVLDADAADAGDVQPRLQRHDVALEQRLVGVADEERRLGVRQAEAVAGVVRRRRRRRPPSRTTPSHRVVDRLARPPRRAAPFRRPPSRRRHRSYSRCCSGVGSLPTTRVLVKSLR